MSRPKPGKAVDPKLSPVYTEPVTGCARCGGEHESVEWHRFQDKPSGRHTHWGTCPTTGDPILQTSFSSDRREECMAILNQIWDLEEKLLDDCYVRDWCYGEYAEQ